LPIAEVEVASVAARDIKKQFGEVSAVNGISLETRDGEFMVLLGPSGCGKTTLLRIIAGLEKQTSGDVLIGGHVVNDMPPRARGIAMVFQSYGLYPHLSVWNNIAFPLRTQGTPREEIKRKVEWASRLLGIERLALSEPRLEIFGLNHLGGDRAAERQVKLADSQQAIKRFGKLGH
jgi:multiple sugar transport system ATP-binding protein